MALKSYQTAMTLSRLYDASKAQISGDSDQMVPNLYINSGTVDVYGSNSATKPANLAAMTLDTENTGVSGVNAFSIIPRWIAVKQNGGATTELVATGLELEDQGAIA